jgi:hypothetical protein
MYCAGGTREPIESINILVAAMVGGRFDPIVVAVGVFVIHYK